MTIAALYLQFSLGFPHLVFLILGSLLALPGVIRETKRFTPVLVFVSIGVCSVLISVAGGIFFWGQLLSLGLLGWTVFAAAGLAVTAQRFGEKRISAWFWRLSLAIIVLAMLEVLGPLRPISDAIRTMLYPENILYAADERDMRVVGFVRPKLFTSEPSHVGKFLAIFLIVSATASRKRGKHILAAIVGFFVVSSPAVLLAAIIPTLLIARDYGFRRLLSSRLVLMALLVVAVGTLYILFDIAHARLGLFGGTVEPSAYVRVIRPFYMLREATMTRPLFGYGLGAEESLTQIATDATLAGPYVKFAMQDLSRMNIQYGSSMIAVILSFGWVGAAVWIWAVGFVRRIFRGDRMVFWVFWLAYGFFQGSINTPIYFVPIFLLAATSAVSVPKKHRRGHPDVRRTVTGTRVIPFSATKPHARSQGHF